MLYLGETWTNSCEKLLTVPTAKCVLYCDTNMTAAILFMYHMLFLLLIERIEYQFKVVTREMRLVRVSLIWTSTLSVGCLAGRMFLL